MISRSDRAFSATPGKLALPLGFRLQRRDQRKMDHIERGWDFLTRNRWQAEAGLVIFCHGGLPRSTLCSENPKQPKEECQQRLCFSRPKDEERREALKSSKVLRRNKQVILLRGKVAL